MAGQRTGTAGGRRAGSGSADRGAILEQAKEILILRRDTHPDSLIDRLRNPRVRRGAFARSANWPCFSHRSFSSALAFVGD
jgi:hypothetical protein